MNKNSLKKLRRETASLRKQVKGEKLKVERERELVKLKSESFRLRHRKKIRFAKGVWSGIKAGGVGLAAVQQGLKRASIKSTFPKPKKRKTKKKKSKKKRRKKVIIKYY